MDKKFTVKNQFNLFLNKMYGPMALHRMSLDQRTQLEQAFFAAWSQYLLAFNELHFNPEDAVEAFQAWEKEVNQYWNKHTDFKNNERKN